MNTFKPTGYNSVSPYFIVKDTERLINLLVQIFEAKELRKYTNSEGGIMHAEVQIDDSVIMLSEASETYPANQFLIHVYVKDAQASYKKAIAAGCEPMGEPKRQEGDPDLRGMFKDFAGNTWAVGTQLS